MGICGGCEREFFCGTICEKFYRCRKVIFVRVLKSFQIKFFPEKKSIEFFFEGKEGGGRGDGTEI